MEFELDVAFRRLLLAQHEVTAPQRPRSELDELRGVAARMAEAIRAGGEFQVVGQRQLVELYRVRARLQTFEVKVAILVGYAVSAILEIDAHVGDAVIIAAVGVTGPFEHAADDEALLRE